MKYLLIALSLLFIGCDTKMERIEKRELAAQKQKFATCSMNNFKSFPSKVTGQIVFVFNKTMTIAVLNRDKSERVDLTFPRSRCK